MVDMMGPSGPFPESKAAPQCLEAPLKLLDRFCRFCYEGEEQEKFIEACGCKGSMRYIHPSCLKKWLQACAKMQERYHGKAAPVLVCRVCQQQYRFQLRMYVESFLYTAVQAIGLCWVLLLVCGCGSMLLGLAHHGAPFQLCEEAGATGGERDAKVDWHSVLPWGAAESRAQTIARKVLSTLNLCTVHRSAPPDPPGRYSSWISYCETFPDVYSCGLKMLS